MNLGKENEVAITSRQKTSREKKNMKLLSSKALVDSTTPLSEKKPQIPCSSFELDSVVNENETNIINSHVSKRAQSSLQIPTCEFYALEELKPKISLNTIRRHSISPMCTQRFNSILAQTRLTLFENDSISTERVR